MKSYIFFISFLCIYQQIIECQESENVKIDVYYETLCPDSIQFIRRQLYPTFNKIGEIMDITLIPYGKAEHNEYKEDVEIYCHHGIKECEGNTIQSCAIQQFNNNMTVILPYINCMETEFYGRRRPQISSIASKCASDHGINYTSIETCSSSLDGKRLHLANGVKTQRLSPSLTFVPWIVINDNYTESNQDTALYGNFKKLICQSYQGSVPLECQV